MSRKQFRMPAKTADIFGSYFFTVAETLLGIVDRVFTVLVVVELHDRIPSIDIQHLTKNI